MKAFFGVLILFFFIPTAARAESSQIFPHIQALSFLFVTQSRTIQEIDSRKESLNALKRTWIVKRPFAPGGFDSTHLLTVVYLIGDKQVKQWGVDLRKDNRPEKSKKDFQPGKTLPHVEALLLLFATQKERIRALDSPQEWWLDIKERRWTVQRRSAPGKDRAHRWEVLYQIEEKNVGKWEVEIRKKEVQLLQ